MRQLLRVFKQGANLGRGLLQKPLPAPNQPAARDFYFTAWPSINSKPNSQPYKTGVIDGTTLTRICQSTNAYTKQAKKVALKLLEPRLAPFSMHYWSVSKFLRPDDAVMFNPHPDDISLTLMDNPKN